MSGAIGAEGLPEPALARPRAWRSWKSWALFVAVIVAGLVADLGSKWAAFEYLGDRPVHLQLERVLEIKEQYGVREVRRAIDEQLRGPAPVVTVVPKVLNFTLVLNPGAVFGTGAGGRWYFISFTMLAMIGAGALFALGTRAGDRWLHAGIGMIVAGGLGNLYDRVFVGCVRDFIQPLPGLKWPFGWDPMGAGGEIWPYVSNVADKLLIIGVIVTAFCLVPSSKPTKPATAGGAGSDADPKPEATP